MMFDPINVFRKAKEAFDKGDSPMICFSRSPKNGHCVLPFKFEETLETLKILVYDPNVVMFDSRSFTKWKESNQYDCLCDGSMTGINEIIIDKVKNEFSFSYEGLANPIDSSKGIFEQANSFCDKNKELIELYPMQCNKVEVITNENGKKDNICVEFKLDENNNKILNPIGIKPYKGGTSLFEGRFFFYPFSKLDTTPITPVANIFIAGDLLFTILVQGVLGFFNKGIPSPLSEILNSSSEIISEASPNTSVENIEFVEIPFFSNTYDNKKPSKVLINNKKKDYRKDEQYTYKFRGDLEVPFEFTQYSGDSMISIKSNTKTSKLRTISTNKWGSNESEFSIIQDFPESLLNIKFVSSKVINKKSIELDFLLNCRENTNLIFKTDSQNFIEILSKNNVPLDFTLQIRGHNSSNNSNFDIMTFDLNFNTGIKGIRIYYQFIFTNEEFIYDELDIKTNSIISTKQTIKLPKIPNITDTQIPDLWLNPGILHRTRLNLIKLHKPIGKWLIDINKL